MTTCSSILAGKIPWTERLGGSQSTGSQRIGQDGATEHTHIFVLQTISTKNVCPLHAACLILGPPLTTSMIALCLSFFINKMETLTGIFLGSKITADD